MAMKLVRTYITCCNHVINKGTNLMNKIPENKHFMNYSNWFCRNRLPILVGVLAFISGYSIGHMVVLKWYLKCLG